MFFTHDTIITSISWLIVGLFVSQLEMEDDDEIHALHLPMSGRHAGIVGCFMLGLVTAFLVSAILFSRSRPKV